ncbi:MAG: riboflavin biosynthesis protein RibF [Lentisphaerae bacterium]|nr:riboflavin biosynthesis protein RibF [Lentisphaerota bacterium]
MQTFVSPDHLHALPGPLVLAAGFFDGVHLGHRAVLDGAIAHARQLGGQAWALTFDQHPLTILAPGRQPPLLTPLSMRLELLAQTGIDGCLMLPFTRELAACQPRDFVRLLCGPQRTVAAIRCGENWRFGAGGGGDPALLAELGRQHGFEAVTVPPLHHDGAPISSTRIRRAIQAGDVAEAASMLGRPYSVRETVVRGRGVGRTIGMATANLHPAAEVLPGIGVYAVRTWVGDRRVDGVAGLGWRPTFADARPDAPELEIHLLDFEGDLYGATLDVAFIARLRDEIKFPDAAALMEQVREDIRQARQLAARS